MRRRGPHPDLPAFTDDLAASIARAAERQIADLQRINAAVAAMMAELRLICRDLEGGGEAP
jgi:hypothetical protein